MEITTVTAIIMAALLAVGIALVYRNKRADVVNTPIPAKEPVPKEPKPVPDPNAPIKVVFGGGTIYVTDASVDKRSITIHGDGTISYGTKNITGDVAAAYSYIENAPREMGTSYGNIYEVSWKLIEGDYPLINFATYPGTYTAIKPGCSHTLRSTANRTTVDILIRKNGEADKSPSQRRFVFR